MRTTREDDLLDRIRQITKLEIGPNTNLDLIQGVSQNELAELQALQKELGFIEMINWEDLVRNAFLRHEREEELCKLANSCTKNKYSVNELLEVKPETESWPQDQKSTMQAYIVELIKLKNQDNHHDNIENQFIQVIKLEKDEGKKEDLRKAHTDFKYDQTDINYNRDARKSIEESLMKY